MQKKVLLRRPKCVNSTETLDSTLTYKMEIRTISTSKSVAEIREDIESEFCSLENQIFKEEEVREINSVDYKIDEYANKDNKDKLAKKMSCVTLVGIESGLMPVHKIQSQLKTSPDLIEISDKTLKQHENILWDLRKPEIKSSQLDIYHKIKETMTAADNSIPKHILIIQMAELLRKQSQLDSDSVRDLDLGCSVRKLNKQFNDSWKGLSRPRYEIVLYEQDEFHEEIQTEKICDILQNDLNKLNQDPRTTRQNVCEVPDEIDPVPISMLECSMTHPKYLNFRAHSINELPEMSLMLPNLTHLDLSYNNFQSLPAELFRLSNLEALTIKNNPITKLSISIGLLSKLKILNCSCTLISSLPIELFAETQLEDLDASYCRIQHFPNIINEKVRNNMLEKLSKYPIRNTKI